jgi:D-psicose/D-tagatose/L-ribulose 3-epimerase
MLTTTAIGRAPHRIARRAANLALHCAFPLCLALFFLATGRSQSRAIQIGYCGPMSQIDEVKAAGFDFMGLRTSEVAALSDADFEKLAAKLKQDGLPALDAYQFLPASIKLTGPAIDKSQQMAYVRLAFDRLSKLGVRIISFGSGPARNYPEGFPKDQAYAQLVDFCKRIGPEARARNITIAFEPMRPQESNLINTVLEGLDFINAVNDPNIQLTLDYYQFEMVKEDPSDILKAGDHIFQIHFVNPNGRVLPLRWEEHDYAPLFANLKKTSYHHEICIEASSTDFAKQAPESIAFLRAALAR